MVKSSYKHMLKNQCISVTQLRTKTKECLDDLAKEPKFIFINNEPVAVLLDIQEYEDNFMQPTLLELNKKEATASIRALATRAKKSQKKDLINL